MNHPIETSEQARAVLRFLRAARGLTQTQAGRLLGVSQKRIARIEADPARTSLGQVARLVAHLGGRVVVETGVRSAPARAAQGRSRR